MLRQFMVTGADSKSPHDRPGLWLGRLVTGNVNGSSLRLAQRGLSEGQILCGGGML